VTRIRSRFLLAALPVLFLGDPALARRARPTACDGGVFVVQGGPLLPHAPASEIDAVEVRAGVAAMSVGCTAADVRGRVRLQARKSFTQVSAAWRGCGGLLGTLRLVGARITDDCSVLHATLRGKGVKRSFTAPLSRCGDGYVDPKRDETCDGAHGCADGLACVACDCVAPVSVTTLPATTTTTTEAASSTTTTTTLPFMSRPYHRVVPSGYDPAVATPLVVMLHGYGTSSDVEDLYLGLSTTANSKGFLYAYPDGTLDEDLKEFWNATDACCNFFGSMVDDVAYLGAVIEDMKAHFHVDPARVVVVGHANGGFMAYRLACDMAAEVTAVVSLAGATWNDTTACKPSLPVSVVQIAGTNDATILYAGGSSNGHDYPSAATTAADWAAYDGCTLMPSALPSLDLDSGLAGSETTVSGYDGCQHGTAVQLWSIQAGTHIPALQPGWFDPVWTFLMAHPRT
jgi:polyhydroxybutyrate depolymerase